MGAKFVTDPRFVDNLNRASNKSRSSLRPLFDQVRKITDEIAAYAKLDLQKLASEAESATRVARQQVGGDVKLVSDFRRAKARAFALKTAVNSVVPTMQYDGKKIFGRVMINRRGSYSIEYGGVDPVGEIGKGTGQFVVHPAYAVLRNAARRVG